MFIERIEQRLLLRGLKFPPKLEWIERLQGFGVIETLATSRDGYSLRVISVTPDGIPDPQTTAVLVHPITRKAKYFFNEGRRLQAYLDADCRLLLFDFNGFGESERHDLFYWKDTAKVIAQARARFNDSRFVLHGCSFGAFHSIRAIGGLPDGSKVVLENTGASFFGYWKRWWTTRFLARAIEISGQQSVKDMDVLSPLRQLSGRDLEVVFIACGNDEVALLSDINSLARACACPNRVELFERSAHLAAPADEAARFQALIQHVAARQ